MRFSRIAVVAAAILGSAFAMSAESAVFVTVGAAGTTMSTATGYTLGVANLDNAVNGLPTVAFTGTPVTGATTNGFVNIGNANVYGGAGGTGKFGTVVGDATIQLSSMVNYFGLWGSALDGNNTVALYSGGGLLGTYALKSVLESSPGYSASYLGNPFMSGNSSEQYAFFNFKSDVAFDQVRLLQNGGGGFEFDNLTVGIGSGTVSAMPDPATWAMMLVGFGAIGCLVRSGRRRTGAVTVG